MMMANIGTNTVVDGFLLLQDSGSNGGNSNSNSNPVTMASLEMTSVKECGDSNPHRYNSKLMNSIWGAYNQYAPHAFQKNLEETISNYSSAPVLYGR